MVLGVEFISTIDTVMLNLKLEDARLCCLDLLLCPIQNLWWIGIIYLVYHYLRILFLGVLKFCAFHSMASSSQLAMLLCFFNVVGSFFFSPFDQIKEEIQKLSWKTLLYSNLNAYCFSSGFGNTMEWVGFTPVFLISRMKILTGKVETC